MLPWQLNLPLHDLGCSGYSATLSAVVRTRCGCSFHRLYGFLSVSAWVMDEAQRSTFISSTDSAIGEPPRKLSRQNVSKPTGPYRRLTRSSLLRAYLQKCLICQEVKPDAKNRRIREGLVWCECDSTPGTLLHAAEVYNQCGSDAEVDNAERILLEIQNQDLWAKDILYHRSC